jgi:hypothetical protein
MIRPARWTDQERTTVASKARIRYLVGGLLIGGFWYLNRGQTPWEEALRTFGIFAVLMLVLKARVKESVEVHLAPVLTAKAVLLLLAVVVQEGLKHSMDNPALVVGIGLGLAVALLGPLGDHRFFTRASAAAPALAMP